MELQREHQAEIDGVSTSQSQAMTAQQISIHIESILSTLVSFESELSMMLTPSDRLSNEKKDGSFSVDTVSNQFQIAAESLSVYIVSDLRCLQYIADRVKIIDEKVRNLRTEASWT